MNTDDLTTGRDTYYVVELNGTTGASIGSPVAVSVVIDGATDYPVALGRQTYQDSIFRILGQRATSLRTRPIPPTWRWSGRTCATRRHRPQT